MDNQNHDPINSGSAGEGVSQAPTGDAGAVSTPTGEAGGTPQASAPATGDDNNGNILNTQVEQAKPFNFMEHLDVEYRNNPSIQKFNDANALAKGYVNLQGMLGKEKAIIPTDLNNAEAVTEYMRKIGTPESVDGYNLEYNQEALGRELDLGTFKELALKNNMTPQQAQGLVSWYAEQVQTAQTNSKIANEQAINDAKNSLRAEWGQAYDERMSKAQSFFKQNFAELAKDDTLMKSLGNNPDFIKGMSNLAGQFSEASIGDVPRQVTMTPSEAQSERAKLMQSPAYMQMSHPEHQATVDKARELLMLAMAGQGQ